MFFGGGFPVPRRFEWDILDRGDDDGDHVRTVH
jgi:hypothetical protein